MENKQIDEFFKKRIEAYGEKMRELGFSEDLIASIISLDDLDPEEPELTPEIIEAIKEKASTDMEKKNYRTKSKAENITEVPAVLPVITNQNYKNAISLNTDDKAYMQPFSSTDNLVFENGQLYFEGMEATAATLKRFFTSDGIENFDLPLLRVFYAIILNNFVKTYKEDKTIEPIITIYYPDLAKKIGKSSNINEKDIASCINQIISFQTIMGIIDKGHRGNDILPVLVYMGNDVEKNTISFSSPYMNRIIQDLYKVSMRKDNLGKPLLKKNGEPMMLPSYSYLLDSTIAKEKNKKAVEIVFIIIYTIENAGNNTPHISADTIIERNQLLKQSIQDTKALSDINKMFLRTFTKAWELLSTKTKLKEYYKEIHLPDINSKDFKAKWIPTTTTTNMVFEFPHKGKIK